MDMMTVRFKVFTSVSALILVFWVVTLYLHRGTSFWRNILLPSTGSKCVEWECYSGKM